MLENNKIFNGIGKAPYDVPDGYFKSLQARLETIPTMTGRTVGPVQRMKPYLALAACFLAAVLIGNTVLRSTTSDVATHDYYNEITLADLIPLTQPDEVFMTVAPERDTISEEDVIDYLITSGMSPEMIEYTGLIAQK